MVCAVCPIPSSPPISLPPLPVLWRSRETFQLLQRPAVMAARIRMKVTREREFAGLAAPRVVAGFEQLLLGQGCQKLDDLVVRGSQLPFGVGRGQVLVSLEDGFVEAAGHCATV